MTVQTFQGDCLEVMETIPEKSVDMVLCDPPYGTTANRWDTELPLKDLWREYRRIVRDGGVTALFSQPPFSFTLGASNISEFRHEWIWRKNVPQGFLSAKKAPLRIHENILIFCGEGTPYNPQMEYGPMRTIRGKGDNWNMGRNYAEEDETDAKRTHSTKSNTYYPVDVIEFPRDFDRHKRLNIHPTQKPVALCEYLIRTYTDEGMTVLDNCMGSGTTGVAAVQTGRNFIGIEKDPDYYQKAVERISKAQYKAKGRTTLEAFA